VTVTAADDEVGVSVSDRGPGIPAADAERVFAAFEQVMDEGEAPDAQSGIGLGLAVARILAEAMGARLTLDAGPGRGTVFTLHAPVAT
jgi:two-component system sensor histidine kinase KdpD